MSIVTRVRDKAGRHVARITTVAVPWEATADGLSAAHYRMTVVIEREHPYAERAAGLTPEFGSRSCEFQF